MNHFTRDIVHGLRVLWRYPGFTATAALTLAFGIGAAVAIFSVVNAVLLRELPYRNSDRLVVVWETSAENDSRKVSPANFLDWRERNPVFEQLVAYGFKHRTITSSEVPEQLLTASASADFFSVLGVNMARGSGFRLEAEDDRQVVISHGLWQRLLGGESDIVGKKLYLDGEAYTLVGVLPAGQEFPRDLDLWTLAPLDAPEFPFEFEGDHTELRGAHYCDVIGRLRSGVTVQQAQIEMDAIARRLEQEYPDENAGSGVRVVPLHQQLVGNVRPALLILLASVGVLLLISCVNAANLLLVRAKSREREIALRTAFGARPRHLAVQLLTESCLLAMLGGGLGLVLTFLGFDRLLALMPSALLHIGDIRIDGSVLAFALLLSLITGVIFGSVPALKAAKPNVLEALKEGSRSSGGRTGRRGQNTLVVTEFALAIILLFGAGLLIKSFVSLVSVSPGFNPDSVVTGRISLPETRYFEANQQSAFFEQLLERLREVPGVKAASIVSTLPLSGQSLEVTLYFEILPSTDPDEEVKASYQLVGSDYFKALNIPLVSGRTFSDADREDAEPVVIVSRTLAQRYYSDTDAIGQRIRFTDPSDEDEPWYRIVGVVGDVHHEGLHINPRPAVYIPFLQDTLGRMSLAVRVDSQVDNDMFARTLRQEVSSIDPAQAVARIGTMDEFLADSVGRRRFVLVMVSIFAATALVLAGLGIYSVMSYTVAQQTREIAMRMAIGARQRQVLKWIVGRGLVLALIGQGVGLVAGLGANQLIKSMLFNVSSLDATVLLVVSVGLFGIAFLATIIPAWNASRIDPMSVLRIE